MVLSSLALTLTLLPSTTAVLAVNGEQDAVVEAQQLRHRLMTAGEEVHAESYMRTRLAPYDGTRTDDALATARAASETAERLAAEGELQAAAARLEEAVDTLSRTPAPTEETSKLEERLRLQAANWRLGMASGEETGRGESPEGRAALQLLTEALVRHPTLALDAARYPPRMRRLLEQARVELSQVGLGEMQVRSSPTGGKVFVDGRLLGTTPLDVAGALPLGSHRVWVEHEGRRSATRDVVLTDEKAVVDVDLVMEHGARSALPALTVDAAKALVTQRAALLATWLDADAVVLVSRDDEGLFAVRLSREGQVVADARAPDVAALADALARGEVGAGGTSWLPSEPEVGAEMAMADDESDGGGSTWLWIGGGAAAAGGAAFLVGAVGAATVATVVVLNGSQPADTGTFTVAVTP